MGGSDENSSNTPPVVKSTEDALRVKSEKTIIYRFLRRLNGKRDKRSLTISRPQTGGQGKTSEKHQLRTPRTKGVLHNCSVLEGDHSAWGAGGHGLPSTNTKRV